YDQCFFTGELQITDQAHDLFRFRGAQYDILNNYDSVVLCFIGKCGDLGNILHFTVQLGHITMWFGAKNSTTAFIQGIPDISFTGSAGTFLLVQLAGSTLHFCTGFNLMRTLALRTSELLNSQIDSMIVGRCAEYFG